MPQRTSTKPKKVLEYPDETKGTRLAAKARKLASQHTPEERRAHINAAMVMIYGGADAKETALPGR
jgi:hypothetical protein